MTTNTNPYDLLGADVAEIDDIDEILELAGADFVVSPGSVQGISPETGDAVVDPSKMALFRTDTDAIIAMHGSGYMPVQYAEVADTVVEALEETGADFKIIKAGAPEGGKKFFMTLLVDTFSIDPEGVDDKVDVYLNALASHDGTLGLTFGYASFRLACMNQAPALRASEYSLTAKHTLNVGERVGVGVKAITQAKLAIDAFKGDAEELQSLDCDDARVLRVIDKLWKPVADIPEGKARTRAEGRRDAIMSIYRSDTCVGSVGNTRWAAFNAITEYLDHARLKGGEDPDYKMASTVVVPNKRYNDMKVAAGRLLLA